MYVVGAGGHARVVLALLRDLGQLVAGVVDEPRGDGEQVLGVAVVRPAGQDRVVLGLGDNAARAQARTTWAGRTVDRPLVHPLADVDPSAELGSRVQVLVGAHVGPQARIGADVIVNTHAVVEHEAVVGELSHVAVGALLLGRCRVGARCLIGAGAVIRDGVAVADDVTVGAGSFVGRDILEPGVYVGSPARRIRP